MINPQDTVISQYANSPILQELINSVNSVIDPRFLLDDFYLNMMDLSTATGYGLDVWGRIVGVNRVVKLPGTKGPSIGFAEGPTGVPFGQATFYSPISNYYAYPMTDDEFRLMILVKAYANITVCSYPELNKMLVKLFGTQGRVTVRRLGTMAICYIFEFQPSMFTMSVIRNTNVVSRPAGVRLGIMRYNPASSFGFSGSGCQPFGQGTFAQGVKYVN